MKIKKGDTVVVGAGKDRGKQAKVLRAFPDDEKVLVEGVNMVRKHERAKKQGQKGQIVSRPMPIQVSNVAVYCSQCGKGVRLHIESVNGKRVRLCVYCRKEL